MAKLSANKTVLDWVWLATVEAVFLDVDGNRHLAVTLDEDPAADLQRWHGRYLYFSPDEVEPQ